MSGGAPIIDPYQQIGPPDTGSAPFRVIPFRQDGPCTAPGPQLSRLENLISASHERGRSVILHDIFKHVEIDDGRHRGFAHHWPWKYPENKPARRVG